MEFTGKLIDETIGKSSAHCWEGVRVSRGVKTQKVEISKNFCAVVSLSHRELFSFDYK